MSSLSHNWGVKSHECEFAFPCDQIITDTDDDFYRGVTMEAPSSVAFRWLCQMRVAPYSYDWIDNLGRRSPRELTPGLDELAVGQQVLQIFELVDFVRDQHLTLRIKQGSLAYRLFGDVAVSYCVVPTNAESCRLVVKMIVRYPAGVLGWPTRLVLPWGDLIMMRRQLLNLKRFAERTVLTGERLEHLASA